MTDIDTVIDLYQQELEARLGKMLNPDTTVKDIFLEGFKAGFRTMDVIQKKLIAEIQQEAAEERAGTVE